VWGEGISCYEADHCTIEDNTVYDNWTVAMYLSDATNSLVQRNMIYFSSKPAIATRDGTNPGGIWLADEVSTVPRSVNNTIINNFIYNTDFEAFTWSSVPKSGLNNVLIANNTIVEGGLLTGSGGSDAIVNVASQIKNNIIFGSNSTVPSKTGLTFSNNNWKVTPAAAKSTTDVTGDPQIARTGTTTPSTLTSAYFKISTTSPVIDHGTPLTAVKDDFFKTVRVTTPDIGGHEVR
jgi:parallel beta-helix repeat protein